MHAYISHSHIYIHAHTHTQTHTQKTIEASSDLPTQEVDGG